MNYSEFIELLEEKGVPAPNLFIPLIIILVLAVAAFVAYPALTKSSEKTVVLTIKDEYGLAVAQAQVLLTGSGFSQTAFTDANGEALFEKVPQADLSASITKEGFQNQDVFLAAVESTSVAVLSAQSSLPKASALKILVVDKNSNNALSQAVVQLSFDGGVKQATTDASGEAIFSLDSLPSDASVQVSKNGFESNSLISLSTQEITDSSFSPIMIYLSSADKPEVKYSFTVSVIDSDEVDVDNVVVTIKDSFGKTIGSQRTSGGQATFSIVAGKEFSVEVTDSSNVFKKFSSETISLNADDGLRVTLEKKVSSVPSVINVVVNDAAGKALSLSDVFLYDIKSNTQLDSKTTDSSGLAKFSDVDAEQSYYISASKEGYLPAIKSRVKPGETYTVSLDSAKAGNNVEATYLVKSSDLAVANAQVALFIAGGSFDGFFLGIPTQETGEDGYAYFTVPKLVPGSGKILAKSTKNELTGESPAQDPKQSFNQTIVLKAPLSQLKLNVTDALTGKQLPATAQVLVDGRQVSSCKSADSYCSLEVSSNTNFVYKVSLPNYVGFESASTTLYPTEARIENVELYSLDSLKQTKVVFDGLYDSLGRQVEFPTNAQEYTAKFTLSVPKSDFSGINIRLGEQLSVENDFAYISSAPLLDSAVLTGGKTFSTTTCQTTGSDLDAYKFIQYDFNQSSGFSKQLSVKIQVFDEVPSDKNLVFYYNAFSSNADDPSIYPFDEKTASNLIKTGGANALSKTDFCVAPQQKTELVFSSFSYSCSQNGVCGLFVFSIDSKKATRNLDVPLGSQARVDYSLVSPTAINSIDVFAKHFTEGDEVLQSGSTATQEGLSVLSLAQDTSSTPAFNVPVDWVKGKTSTGSFSLKAVKPSTSALVSFQLNGESDSTSPKFSTTLRVPGKRVFKKPVFSPEQFTSGVPLDLSFDLFDSLGERVSDAQVTAFECEGKPLNGVEQFLFGDGSVDAGKNGHYSMELKPSKLGKIGVRVENIDFTTYETSSSDCISVVRSDYLGAEPSSISLQGDSSTVLTNTTLVYSLLPVSTRVSTSFSCDGSASSFVKVSPSSFELSALSETELTLTVQKGINVKEKYCVLNLNAEAGATSVQNYLISVFLNVSDYTLPAIKDLTPGAMLVFPLSKNGDIAFASAQYSTKALGELQSCSLMEFSQSSTANSGTTVSCLDNGRIMQVTASYDLTDSSVCFPQTGLIQLTAPNGVSQFLSLKVIGPSGARQCAVTPTATTSPQCVGEGYSVGSGGECCYGLVASSTGVCVASDACSTDYDCPSGQACSLGSCVVRGISYDVVPSTILFKLTSSMEATKYFDVSKVFATNPASAPDSCEISQATLDSESKGRLFAKCELDTTGTVTVLQVDASYAAMKYPYLNYEGKGTILLKRQGMTSKEISVKVSFDPSTAFPENKPDCSNAVLDGDEQEVDCGGSCPTLCSKPSCDNRIKDENEEGVDCGGVCASTCVKSSLQKIGSSVTLTVDSILQDKKLFSLEPIESAGCKITSCSIRPSISDTRLNPSRPITSYVALDEAKCLDGVLDVQAEYNSFPGLYRFYQGSGSILFECENKPSVQRPLIVNLDSSLIDLPENQLTCSDGKKNADETGVDCGGSCEVFEKKACPQPTCSDGVSNGDETGVDCGGSCDTICTADLYESIEDPIYVVLDNDATFQRQYNLNSIGSVTSCSVKMTPLLAENEPRGTVTASCSNNVLSVDAQYSLQNLYNYFRQGGRVSFNLKNGGRTTRQIIVDANNVYGVPLAKPIYGVASIPSSISLVTSSSPYQFSSFGSSSSERTYNVKFADAPSCDVKGFALNYLDSSQYYPQNSFAQTPFNQQNWMTGYGNQQYSYNPIGVPLGCQPPEVFLNPLGCSICEQYMNSNGNYKSSTQLGSSSAYSGLYSQNPLFPPNSGIPVECSPPMICTKQGFDACQKKYCQSSILTNSLNQYVAVTADCDESQLSVSVSYNGPSQSDYGTAFGRLVVSSGGKTRSIPVNVAVMPATTYGGSVVSDSKTMYCSGQFNQFSRIGAEKGIPTQVTVYVNKDTGFGETLVSGLEIANPILYNADLVKSAAAAANLQVDDVSYDKAKQQLHVKVSALNANTPKVDKPVAGNITWSYGFAYDFTTQTQVKFVKDDFEPTQYPLFVFSSDARTGDVYNSELSGSSRVVYSGAAVSGTRVNKFAGIDSSASSVSGLKSGEISFKKGIISFEDLSFNLNKVTKSSEGSVFVKTSSAATSEVTHEIQLLPIRVPNLVKTTFARVKGTASKPAQLFYSINSNDNTDLLPKFYYDGKKPTDDVTCKPDKTTYNGITFVSCELTESENGLNISFAFDDKKLGERIDQKILFHLTYLGETYDFTVQIISEAIADEVVVVSSDMPVIDDKKRNSEVDLTVWRFYQGEKTKVVISSNNKYAVNSGQEVRIDAEYSKDSEASAEILCDDNPQVSLSSGEEKTFDDKKYVSYLFTQPNDKVVCRVAVTIDKNKPKIIKISSEEQTATGATAGAKKSTGATRTGLDGGW